MLPLEPELIWEQWQWRGTPHSQNLRGWSLAIRLFNVISKSLFGDCGGLTPLQKCNRFILQPQLEELNREREREREARVYVYIYIYIYVRIKNSILLVLCRQNKIIPRIYLLFTRLFKKRPIFLNYGWSCSCFSQCTPLIKTSQKSWSKNISPNARKEKTIKNKYELWLPRGCLIIIGILGKIFIYLQNKEG